VYNFCSRIWNTPCYNFTINTKRENEVARLKLRAFQEEQDMSRTINGIRKEEVKLFLMNMPKIG